MNELFQYGLPGVLAFGSVAVVTLIAKRRFNKVIDPETKLYLLGGFAFVYLFIPLDLGGVLFNQIKAAVGIALGISAFNTVANKLGGNK